MPRASASFRARWWTRRSRGRLAVSWRPPVRLLPSTNPLNPNHHRIKELTMEPLRRAYKKVSERGYRETSALYYEDFEPGDVFEHRPGRTVLQVDNPWFTLLT